MNIEAAVAFEQAEFAEGFVGVERREVDGVDGEDAGEDRAERAADAVNAEGVQRIVVAELVLEASWTVKKQTTPAIRPMRMAYIGVVNPLAGVMTTRPATAPEIAPSTVGLPVLNHSMNAQASAPAAAAKWVAMKALLARPPAPRRCRR